jgi:hypothetical protein
MLSFQPEMEPDLGAGEKRGGAGRVDGISTTPTSTLRLQPLSSTRPHPPIPKPSVCMTCVLAAPGVVAAAPLLALVAVLTPNENLPMLAVLGSVRLVVSAAELCGRPVLAAFCVRNEEGKAYCDAVFVAADDTPGIAAELDGIALMFLLVELNFACAMTTSFLSRSYTKYADHMNESPRISVSTSSLWSSDSIAMLSWHARDAVAKGVAIKVVADELIRGYADGRVI